MSQAIKRTLRDSAAARWTALAIVSFTMFAGYLFTDILAPLKPLLTSEMGWTSIDFGNYQLGYAIFNVLLFMLIISGFILDKKGIRFSLILSAFIMMLGAGIKYFALKYSFDVGATTLGIKSQIFWAGFGYATFGVGVEFAGITVSKVVVKWFKGKQLALAMGLQVAIARLGSAAALVVPPYFATRFNITTPVMLGFVMLVIGLLAFIFYSFMDRRLDAQLHIERTESGAEEEEGFRLSDVSAILKNRGFWYIALLCVLFYGAVFPFYKYGTDLFVNKFGLPLNWASRVPSIVPFGTIALTPLFGNIYDRKGKGATIMIIGSLMLTGVHLVLFAPFITNVWVAAVAVVILGVAFSLVPAAMWPSVAKIIPENRLGTAFALIFWIQNIGLGFIPWLLGFVLEKTNPNVALQLQQGQDVVYNYTPTMFVFVVLSASSIVVAFLLKRDDRISGYGLEEPNMAEKR